MLAAAAVRSGAARAREYPMSPSAWIVLLWLGFAGSHLLMSHLPVRHALVARLGAQPFQGVYSLVALAFFVPMAWTYFSHLHEGGWLWVLPRSTLLVWAVQAGLVVAVTLLVVGVVRPSPASFTPGPAEPVGAFRITRHPVVMGLGMIGALHLVLNASATDVAFFAGFPLFALVGCWHQDRRKLAEGTPGYAKFVEQTAFVPFARGGGLRAVREIPPLVLALGVGVALVLRFAHGLWRG